MIYCAKSRLTVFLAPVLLGGGLAWGDIVFLTNGGTLEGEVSEKDGKVYIEQPDGVIIVERERVERIEEKQTDLGAYQERFAQIDEKGKEAAEQFAALGQWCGEHRLKKQALVCYQKTLALDPNHERARNVLGYAKYNGAWMSLEEIQQARGMVRFKNMWVTPEAKEELTRLEAAQDLERTRMEVEKARLEVERLKLARAEAEASRTQAEATRLELSRRYAFYPYSYELGYGCGYYAPIYVQGYRPGRNGSENGAACNSAGKPSGPGASSGSAGATEKPANPGTPKP